MTTVLRPTTMLEFFQDWSVRAALNAKKGRQSAAKRIWATLDKSVLQHPTCAEYRMACTHSERVGTRCVNCGCRVPS